MQDCVEMFRIGPQEMLRLAEREKTLAAKKKNLAASVEIFFASVSEKSAGAHFSPQECAVFRARRQTLEKLTFAVCKNA